MFLKKKIYTITNMWSVTLCSQNLIAFPVLISVVASAGVFGWVAPIMNQLLDPKSDLHLTTTQLSWMIVIPEVGDLLISIPANAIANKWGRKPLILISGPMFAMGWVIIMYTKSYTIICFVRILQGVGIGIVFSVVPTYISEILTPTNRGSVTSLISKAWILGYLLEYCVGPFVSYSTFTALTTTVPIIFVVTFSCQPETPYYLLLKGKYIKAKQSLVFFRKGNTDNQINDELERINQSVRENMAKSSFFEDLISSDKDRRALFIILLIGSIRILNGGFAIMAYSSNLFSEDAPSFPSLDTLTMIMGVSLYLGGFINSSIVHILGIRPLIFISTISSFFCMLAMTVYFFIQSKLSTRIVPLAIISYSIFNVVGLYPVLMTYTSELFAEKSRGRTASISSTCIAIVSYICVKMYQLLADNYGLVEVLLCFTTALLFGAVLLYVYAPELEGKTFSKIREDIAIVLNKKTSTFRTRSYNLIEV